MATIRKYDPATMDNHLKRKKEMDEGEEERRQKIAKREELDLPETMETIFTEDGKVKKEVEGSKSPPQSPRSPRANVKSPPQSPKARVKSPPPKSAVEEVKNQAAIDKLRAAFEDSDSDDE